MNRKLFIVRHGIAEDKEKFALQNPNDGLRPLTKEGITRFTQVMLGYARFEKIDLILHSPWLRAKQTAQIISETFPKAKLIETAQLIPNNDHEVLIKEINNFSESSIAIVGHEPHLSFFTCYLMAGMHASFLTFKKGGIAGLEFEDKLAAKHVTLRWLSLPKFLMKSK